MRTIMCAVSAAIISFLSQGACLAQSDLPYGNYRLTCQDININGDSLSARCQKVDGTWRNTSIDYPTCRGSEIINDDGYLRCSGEGGYYGRPGAYAGDWQGGLPYGNYRQTCQDINVNGNRLSARCQKVDGGWRNTSIDYQTCRGGEIINDNGNLRCGGQGGYYGHPGGGYMGGWEGGLPPGDYKRTCQNMHVSGNKLYATCQKADGSWHDTSLSNFKKCRNPIANADGNLRCPK